MKKFDLRFWVVSLFFVGSLPFAGDAQAAGKKKKDSDEPTWFKPKIILYEPPPPEVSTSTVFHAVDPQIIQKLIELLDERNLGDLESGEETPLLEEIKTFVTPEGFALKNRYTRLGVALSESLGWEGIKHIRVISEQNLKERLTTVARWDHTPNVRSIALIALGSLKSKGDLVYFTEALWSRNVGIRYATVEALEAWGHAEAKSVLKDLIDKDESPLIRVVAAKALYGLKDPQGREFLRNNLQINDWFVRALSAKYLGEMGDHEDYEVLVNQLSRENSLNSNEFAIAEISIAALKLFPHKLEYERLKREERRRKRKKKPLSPSQTVAKNRKPASSQGVLFELEPLVVTAPRLKIPQGELVDSRVNHELLKMLREKEDLRITQEMVDQSSAYKDLNELVTPSGIGLKTRYTVLGFLMTEGLAGTQDFQLLDQLIRIAREGKNPDVRSYAIIALSYNKDRNHLGIFQEALRRENSVADRFAAVEALQNWGYQDAISILIGVSKLDPSPIIKLYSSQAILRLGDPLGRDFLILSLNDQEWLIRAMAMRYLGELGTGRDYDKLLSYFGLNQQKIVQAEMCASLLRLYSKKVDEEEAERRAEEERKRKKAEKERKKREAREEKRRREAEKEEKRKKAEEESQKE